MSRRTTDFNLPDTTLSDAAYSFSNSWMRFIIRAKDFFRVLFLGNGKQFLELQETQRVILRIHQGYLVICSCDEILGNVQQYRNRPRGVVCQTHVLDDIFVIRLPHEIRQEGSALPWRC